MASKYSIYPGIGIARVGNSPDSFFLSPEVSDLGPIEYKTDDSIEAVVKYKDNQGRLRRQAARFRIIETTTDAAGNTTWQEITSADATIEWSVQLGNEKAAAGRFVSENNPESGQVRNPNVATADLTISPVFPIISGNDKTVIATTDGTFKNQPVYLGELKTDSKGRLLVLGGHGESKSVPPGAPLGEETYADPNHPVNDFANNECWHDDISDGPVSAKITFLGQAPIELEDGWVIVAPPDYSPYTRGVTTLFDIATQAAVESGWANVPAQPSFNKDILPILKAVSNLQWVSKKQIWRQFSNDWVQLGTRGTPASDALRNQTYQLLTSLETGTILNFHFTALQRNNLQMWDSGAFISDYDPAIAPHVITPEGLDKASLEQGVGGGFYPGIEAGIIMTYKELYASPYRITRATFTSHTRNLNPHPGFISRNMACPWQADFLKCAAQDGGVWWPAQRPIEVKVVAAAGLEYKAFMAGVETHQSLIDNFGKLGVVEHRNSDSSLIETERAVSLPRN
ncbi:MAG: LodA/GoxA family CTQ-dependent oxidase [Candidatus Obscuribacterales bacterium]|jgi:hypothetical protein